jgi:hypothetical protein
MRTRTIGKVTTASATGGAVGAALAGIIVWVLERAGVDARELEAPITVVLTALLGLLGGWAVPAPNEEDLGEDDGAPEDPEQVENVADYYDPATDTETNPEQNAPVEDADPYEPRHSA